ncbi:MAG: hypothetical protein LH606_08925, partial [Cytophagaceae bacterium]|nr:hypothetical protein [Cytophagaceae bacterium]
MKALLLFIILNTIAFSGLGQLLREDYFDYPIGNLPSPIPWTSSGSGAAATVGTENLTPPNAFYPSPVGLQSGKSVSLANGANIDYSRTFSSSPSSGFVYTAFLLNVTSGATAGGGYFLSTLQGAIEIGRLYARSSDTGYQLGVQRQTSTVAYASVVLTYNTTYLVVMKYNFVTGSTNDVV